MSVIILLIPASILLAGLALVACIIAIRSGQFRNVESQKWKILFDQDLSEVEEEKING